MIRRYVTPDQISIEQEFDLVRSAWEFPANYNAAPNQDVPIIRVIEGQPDPVVLTWGFGEHGMATLAVESLNIAPDNPGLLAQGQRCIFPAMGFYEWTRQTGGLEKPFFIRVEDQEICGFAGFWERESCTIITLPANEIMLRIDNEGGRMPAILSRDMRDIWLYGSAASAAGALAAYPSDKLVAYAVSRRVDSSDNNDEMLMDPLETDVD